MPTPMMAGKSSEVALLKAYNPRPGQEKTLSVTTAPERSPPKLYPMTVSVGMRLLRAACWIITPRSPTPLARAVRT